MFLRQIIFLIFLFYILKFKFQKVFYQAVNVNQHVFFKVDIFWKKQFLKNERFTNIWSVEQRNCSNSGYTVLYLILVENLSSIKKINKQHVVWFYLFKNQQSDFLYSSLAHFNCPQSTLPLISENMRKPYVYLMF